MPGHGGKSLVLALALAGAVLGCRHDAGRNAGGRDAGDEVPRNVAGPGCSCTEDDRGAETSLACFCTWFSCPSSFESAVEEAMASGCGPRHPYTRVVLWTYADCKRLYVYTEMTDGPVWTWVFDADSRALIGGSRSAWPVTFRPPICPNLPSVGSVRAGPALPPTCAPTSRNLCPTDAGTGADIN